MLPELDGPFLQERSKIVRGGFAGGACGGGQSVDGRAFLDGDQVVEMVVLFREGTTYRLGPIAPLRGALKRVNGLHGGLEGVEGQGEVSQGAVGQPGIAVADVDVQACRIVSGDGPGLIGRQHGNDMPDLSQALAQTCAAGTAEDAGGDLDPFLVDARDFLGDDDAGVPDDVPVAVVG